LIQDHGKLRNLDSKICLPGFYRFKFQFHSFFAEAFSTVSVKLGHSAMLAQCPVCAKADTAGRFMSTRALASKNSHIVCEGGARRPGEKSSRPPKTSSPVD
jgi:hypothetical protein